MVLVLARVGAASADRIAFDLPSPGILPVMLEPVPSQLFMPSIATAHWVDLSPNRPNAILDVIRAINLLPPATAAPSSPPDRPEGADLIHDGTAGRGDGHCGDIQGPPIAADRRPEESVGHR